MDLSNTILGGNDIFNSNNFKKNSESENFCESEELVYVKIWGNIFSFHDGNQQTIFRNLGYVIKRYVF